MEAYDVRQLPEEGAELNEELSPAWLEEALNAPHEPADLTFTADGPGHAKLALSPIEARGSSELAVRVSGRVRASLKTHCVRCLAELELKVSGPVEVTLIPASVVASPHEEETSSKKKKPPKIEIRRESLDESTYQDHLIDLPGIVREALLLGLEMNPSCADEQACSARTAELVQVANHAEPEAPRGIDPRWADLVKLRSKSS